MKNPSPELLSLFHEHGRLSGMIKNSPKRERVKLLERLRIVGEKIIKLESAKR